MVQKSDSEKYLEIIKQSPFIVISRKIEDDLPVVRVTENIKQFGYSPDEFISRNMNFGEIIHPDDFKIISKAFRFLNPKVTDFVQEYRIIAKSGAIHYIEEKAKIRREENGDFYLDGIINDITNRKNREILYNQDISNYEDFGKETPLDNVLSLLVTNAEMVRPDLKCAIILLDKSKKTIFHVVAPNLPAVFRETFEGMDVEYGTGCCVKSIRIGKRVILDDINKQNYCTEYKDFAKIIGFNACWSEPIVSSKGEILGAFSMYFENPKSPKKACEYYLKANADIAAFEIENRIVNETFRDSEQKFKKIFNNINDLVFVSKPNGSLIDVNQVVIDTLGYSKKYILDSSPECIVPYMHVKRASELAKIIRNNGEAIYESAVIRKDGQAIPLEVNARRINYNGKEIILSVARDITDRKKAEKAKQLNESRLEALAKLNDMSGASMKEITNFAMEEAVRLTSSTLGYLAFTNADESMLIMHSWSKSAMKECNIEDKIFTYPVATTGLWGEAVRSRKPIITNDYSMDNLMKKGYPAGHVQLTRHMNVPVFDGDHIVAVVGVGNKEEEYDESDVLQLTLLVQAMWKLIQRKQIVSAFSRYSTELLEANKELRSINWMKENYIEEIYHKDDETSLLECEALDNEGLNLISNSQKKAMSALLHNSEKIKRLSDILFYQNMKSLGKIKYSFEALNIYNSMSDALLNLILLVDEKNIDLNNEIPNDLPYVKGDRDKLTNVFINLIDHAIDLTPEGKSINLKAYKEDVFVHLEIRDMGPGVQSDLIPHVFHSFYHPDESSAIYGSIESGLQMCKDIVDAHKGNIWIESELEKGTIVHIQLPLWEDVLKAK